MRSKRRRSELCRKIRSDFEGDSEIDRIMREMDSLRDQLTDIKEILSAKN